MDVLNQLLPASIQKQMELRKLPKPEEVRLRVGQPVMVKIDSEEVILPHVVSPGELEQVLQRAGRQSAYAWTEEIRNGYLTVERGHRIGICGRAVTEQGSVRNITDLTSLNIRLASEHPEFGRGLASKLEASTLIIGPPGCGKTTLLRTMIRELSDVCGQTVGVADERGEIAACVHGIPQLNVGMRTDVITAMDKAQAVMQLLRVMAPQWIAVDEITAPADCSAMETAGNCGVKLLATVHGDTPEDLLRRPLYDQLRKSRIFSQIIRLKTDKTYEMERWNP